MYSNDKKKENLKSIPVFTLYLVCEKPLSMYNISELGRLMGGGGRGPMSHVDFKKWQCHMSLSLIFPNVTCRI